MKLNKKILIPGIAVILAAILFGAYMLFIAPKPMYGEKNVDLIIAYDDYEKTIEVKTDSLYLKDLLEELQEKRYLKFETKSSEYGPYLFTMNDRSAAEDKNEYYALYIKGAGDNDEFGYGTEGISTQVITDGYSYKIILEKW